MSTAQAASSIGDASCENRLRIAYDPQQIGSVLRRVPVLQSLVLEILRERELPASIRRILTRTLSHPDLTVLELTNQLRVEWHIAETTRGMARDESDKITLWVDKRYAPTLNQEAGNAMTGKFETSLGVLVGDELDRTQAESLSFLIHELAHIRMNLLLRKILEDPEWVERWKRNLPSGFVRVDEAGQVSIYNQFYDLLQEKFAWEMQGRFIEAGTGKYFRWTPWAFEKMENEGYRASRDRQWLVRKMTEHYRITDPAVLALRDVPMIRLFGSVLRKAARETGLRSF